MKILSIILILIFSCSVNAQYKSSYCECKVKGTKILNSSTEGNVDLSSIYFEGNINIKIINNTNDTIFIFKSYFENDISSSPYLCRYDKKRNEVNISYLPLLPYLYTKYSDKIIFQDRIVKDYQVVYDFYKIPPVHEYSFSVKTLDFKNLNKFIEDFDIFRLNKFEKIKRFKKVKLKRANPLFFINLAYYVDVKTICNSNSYYQEELEFNSDAKNFKILRSKIE